MSEIIYSKPFKPMGYQLGRLVGAYCVTLMVFAMVPLGLFLGSLMPWIDSQRMGPYHLSYYLLPFMYFMVPGLFVLTCLFYTAALKFRSMMSAYLVAVAMFMAYRVSRTVLSGPEYREISALADPFGLSTFAEVSRYWTAFEKNQAIIEFAGTIGANRILWLVIGIAILLIFGGFHRRMVLPSKKIKKPKKNAKAELPAPMGNSIAYKGSGNNNWLQFITRTRFEMKQVLLSAPFYVLITMCIFVVIMQFINPNGMYGTPDWPFTHNMVNLVIGGFSLVTIIIIAYYSAEVVWRERGVGIGDITDSMPVANLTFWLSKLLAVCLVVVVMHLIGMAVTVTYQLIKGHESIEIGQYLVSLLYFQALPMCLSVVAAFFIQVLSPSKNIGMLFFVGFFTISQLLGSMGLEHNMYSIGSSPTMIYSDLNGYGVYLLSHHWYMLYWVALAVVISVVGYGLWHRGPQQSLKARARLMPYHFGSTGKLVLSVSMAVFVLSGSYIIYNTRVLNEFVSSDQANDNSADYEKKYIAYQHATLPMITHVNATVDIMPEQRKIVASAKIKVRNTSDQ
ncbi:MAG: hypothetical protein MJK04_10800, partial [Psychrosphaera sp.]|nr:hypothetical protein [Psychrosphaera sp.]